MVGNYRRLRPHHYHYQSLTVRGLQSAARRTLSRDEVRVDEILP